MNKWIADVFGSIVALMHIGVVITIISTLFYFYQNKQELYQFGITPDLLIPIALGVFFFYVLLAGLLSTFIAIFRVLSEISKKLDK